MDKQQARDIVKGTMGASFDKGRFTLFIKNLLNEIDESETARFVYQGNYIPDAYKQYISSLERVGKYSSEDYKIDILIVKLKKETSIERARTMQRNFIARYLNGSRGGALKDAALVAFVSPDNEDWRFSLVKMNYSFEEGKNGRVKVKEEFTPARRWSFLVGQNENSHTAQTRLLPIMADDGHSPVMAELEEAFNIETVTKEFFTEYRNLFILVKESLDAIVKKDTKIKINFEQNGVNTVDFAKKLLGQIVFLYFLQKKGWFGVAKNAAWGTGSKQFLRELFEKKHSSYKNFFNDILEPLFYEALRLDRSHEDHYYSRFNCKIPFLNGGLFDPIKGYDWVKTDILLPNELFSNTNKTKEGDTGNGILDVFDRYNFTVKEDEPLEKEVAIDPELLGKAYEKFNAIRPDNFEEYRKALKSGKKGEESKFNKQFGVYYTPREIVHYMCQQSLINYLSTQFNGGAVIYEKAGDSQTDMLGNVSKGGQLDLTIEHKEKPAILQEDIETLIHLGERLSENEAMALIKQQRINEGYQKTSDYKVQLPESIHKNAKQIDEKLSSIKVCDPAIGSGAFPVGMMSEIVKVRNTLSAFIKNTDKSTYHFKRDCIENSLYGVDIDSGAIEIAKLRLWLSLVVDEDNIKQIKPLPNLDYKIVCGDSLIGFPDQWDSPVTKEIESLKHNYFSETNPTKKSELREKIDGKITGRYLNSLRTFGYEINFDFRTAFSEVFHEAGGFNIVIANPPYITVGLGKKQKYFSEKQVTILKKLFDNVFEYKGNTFVLFLSKALNILSVNGVLTYIIPNTLLLNSTFEKARKCILNNSDVDILFNFKASIFEEAETGGNLIIVLDKQKTNNRKTRVLELDNLEHFAERKGYRFVEQRLFERDGGYRFNIEADDNDLINKIKTDVIPLGSIVKFYQGIITGDNDKFIVNKKSHPLHKALLRGKDICKYYYSFDNNYVLFDPKKLWSNTNEAMFHVKEKIINRQTGSNLIGAYDDKGYFSLDSTHVQILVNQNFSLKFILALFNSRLLNYYYNNKVKESGRVFAQIKIIVLKELPIKNAAASEQVPFVNLVDLILKGKRAKPQADTSALEAKIDQMVYALYNLTPAEIAIVEGQ